MNILNEINILIPKLNSKQKEFVENFSSEFQKIEERLLSKNSYVDIKEPYLIIYIEHVSDKNTWIEFKIERREIYITVVGFGYSMWQVAKGEGIEFNNGVRELIISAFTSKFKKTAYYDKNDELIKESLVWNEKPELLKVSVFGNFKQIIRKWFTNKFRKTEYRTYETNYSKFI